MFRGPHADSEHVAFANASWRQAIIYLFDSSNASSRFRAVCKAQYLFFCFFSSEAGDSDLRSSPHLDDILAACRPADCIYHEHNLHKLIAAKTALRTTEQQGSTRGQLGKPSGRRPSRLDQSGKPSDDQRGSAAVVRALASSVGAMARSRHGPLAY